MAFDITVKCVDGKPDADPINVPFGRHEICWIPEQGVNITGITFDDPNAPFTPPKKENGKWCSEDDNRNTTGQPKSWSYTISGSCTTSGEPVTVDPEIVNDPKGDKPEDKDKDKGKGDERSGG